MQKEKKINNQKSLSMEEYLSKRQETREIEKEKRGINHTEENSSAWILAKLYV